ncbi:vesicular glutamate transporter 2.2-like [Saccostrea echinata]|uniref:vesicular glutamate transporter 2.2-like n=1 Tax=Saccostrea echinata TaxID=191078 RepID=UPI002A835D5B|nr:vesicular glutamate transporter 2.2-like [Saccostrea echinata]
MAFQRRIFIVFLGFMGLLLSIGYRSVFSMVMVHIIKSSQSREGLFGKCTVNGTSRDFSVTGWTSREAQYFQTSYFFGSFIMQLPGGYLATRFSPRRVCGLSIMISSVLMIVLPFPIRYLSSPIPVFLIRFLQGLVEGWSVPAMNGVISAWAPKSEKSRMVTVVYAGAYLSPALAMVITGVTACWVSWNTSLFLYGGLGFIWSVVWVCAIYDTPGLHPNLHQSEADLFAKEGANISKGSQSVAKEIPWTKILRSLPVWAIILGSFCRNWIFSMMITQVPQYFKDAFRKDIATIGFTAALPEVLMTIVTISGGVLIDKLIKHHLLSTTHGRKLAQCMGFGIEAFCLLGLRFVHSSEIALVLLCVGVGFSGLAISGYQVNPLDLAPQYVSILTGLSRLGTLGAILSTAVAGKLAQQNIQSWQLLFTIAASIHLAGVVFYGIFASGERQPWSETAETRPLLAPAVSSETIEDLGQPATTQNKFSASMFAFKGKRYLIPELDEDGNPSWFLNTI